MTSKTDNTLLSKMDIGKGLPAGVVLGLIFGIGFGDRDLLITGSTVAGCDPDRFHGWAAPQSPAESMLPATTADD